MSYFSITTSTTEDLQRYLRIQNWIDSTESVLGAGPAGEGNMNHTLRVKTNQQSLILKQAPPHVAKFPTIKAPKERALIEARFYSLVNDTPVASSMPKLIGQDSESDIIALQDLGEIPDLTTLYGDRIPEPKLIEQLFGYLSRLHSIEVSDTIKNTKMRQLNHDHIFELPFGEEACVDLDAITPGLSALRQSHVLSKTSVAKYRHQLGEIYLDSGDCLLHGDFYPGSWIESNGTVYVIDPEFGFHGEAEFDLGVLLAHLHLCGIDEDTLFDSLEIYKNSKTWEQTLAFQFAGIEILRRLYGVAQLPLRASLEQKQKWTQTAVGWVCT